MRTRPVRSIKRAFTLIEILIVVVILGILAAIVIPQFTDASQQASASSIKSTLQTVRSQIELYRVKNNGANPPSIADLVIADPPYLQRDPNDNVPNGFVYVYNATTGVYSAECDSNPNCPDDIATW